MSNETGSWVQTLQGRAWSLLNPRRTQETVDLHELSIVLSRLPRFNGHTRLPLSVAEHSLNVMFETAILSRHNPRAKMLALLHDAHEFVLGDICTPVVEALEHLQPGVRDALADLKRGTDMVIFEWAGLTRADVHAFEHIVRDADRRVLMAERRKHMASPPMSWGEDLEATPLARAPVFSTPYSPELAAQAFRYYFMAVQTAMQEEADAEEEEAEEDARRAWDDEDSDEGSDRV